MTAPGSGPTRVVIRGLGEIGSKAARILLRRPQVEIVGVISHQVGEDLGEAVGVDATGLKIVGEPQELAGLEADICLLATKQKVAEVHDEIAWALDSGMAVIASGEEMIFPWAAAPDLAESIDRRARAAGRAVLGTGVNPGFVMDVLPLCLSSACADIERLEVTRASDFSPYGPLALRSLGVGLSPEQFQRDVETGKVDGHIGFDESIGMMARAIGWTIDYVRDELRPIIAKATRTTPHVTVEPGQVAGCEHEAVGYSEGEPKIVLTHPQQVDPAAEDAQLYDSIRLVGVPTIEMEIKPEIEGGTATAARMVNSIGAVLDAAPGLRGSDELPLPRITPLGR